MTHPALSEKAAARLLEVVNAAVAAQTETNVHRDEVAAEVYARLLSHLDAGNQRLLESGLDQDLRRLFSYAAVTARSVQIDLWRKQSSRNAAETAAGRLVPGTDEPTPLDEAIRAELQEIMDRAVHRLGQRERLLLKLAVIDGLSHSQIADLENSDRHKVRHELDAALLRLRSELSAAAPDNEPIARLFRPGT